MEASRALHPSLVRWVVRHELVEVANLRILSSTIGDAQSSACDLPDINSGVSRVRIRVTCRRIEARSIGRQRRASGRHSKSHTRRLHIGPLRCVRRIDGIAAVDARSCVIARATCQLSFFNRKAQVKGRVAVRFERNQRCRSRVTQRKGSRPKLLSQDQFHLYPRSGA